MMTRHGFTLVEALLALIIAAGLFVLADGLDRRLLRPLRQDPMAWHQAVRVLEQPGRYRVVKVHQRRLDIADTWAHNKLLLVWVDDKHVLRLTNSTYQGYYPLLRQVEAVEWQRVGHTDLVQIRLKQERLPWQKTILNLRGKAF